MSEGRLAKSRPLGEGSEPCLAAKRPTASDEVARGRLVSLDGFPFVHLHFASSRAISKPTKDFFESLVRRKRTQSYKIN